MAGFPGVSLAIAVGVLAAVSPRSGQAQPLAADEPMHLHRIEKGDTLIGLQSRLMTPGASWRRVQRINGIADPRRLPIGGTLRIPVSMLRGEDTAAEVLHVWGDVTVAGPDGVARRVVGGDRLAGGDLLVSGRAGTATLRFADGSRVVLQPASRLRIERHARLPGDGVDVRLRLDQGGAESRVPPERPRPRFEIRTPVVNLGVRGTEFRTRVEERRTLAEVLEGRVSADRATVLGAGQGAVVGAGGVESLRQLDRPPDVSAVPERVELLPLDLPVRADGPAQALRVQIFDSEGARLRLEGRFDDGRARWPDDLPDGNYELHARTIAADGLEGRDARTTFRLKARPQAPLLQEPGPDHRTSRAEVPLAWTRNPAAHRYRLQVADGADFAAPRLDRDNLVDPGARLALPPGVTHWRVAGIDAQGERGPWSAAGRITREPEPPPGVESPQAVDGGVALRWAPGSPGSRFRIQVARDAAFAEIAVDEILSAAAWTWRAPAAGKYHVRVQTIAADGLAGPFGSPQQFEVAPRRGLWWVVPLLWLLLL